MVATMFYIGKALIQSSQVMLVIGLSCWRLCRLIITPVHHVLFSSVDHIITSIKIKKKYISVFFFLHTLNSDDYSVHY